MPGDSASHLARAHAALECACRALIRATPQDVDQCEAALDVTVKELMTARNLWNETPPDPEQGAGLKELRVRIYKARRLLRNAMEYHAKWERVLAAMTGGYTAAGSPRPLGQRGQISLAG